MDFVRVFRDRLPDWLMDVRLWILVFFLIRLESIDLPPLDEHSHRQTLTLMVARNLVEVSPNPLLPMLSFGRENKPGPVGMEPSLYTGLIALFYTVFGENYWSGRLINLVVSSFGLWFFFAFLRKFWRREEALAATVFFAVSVAFVYSRKSMPDTFALSFVFASLFYGANYLEKGGRKSLWAFVATLAVGVLVKMPASFVAPLLLLPLLQEGVPWRRRGILIAAGLLPAALMSVWYFWWVPTIIKNGGLQLYETYGFREGWRQFWEHREGVWQTFTFTQMKTWAAFALLLPGVYFLGYRRQDKAIAAILTSAGLCAIFFIQAAYAYPTHEYYGMPLNPAYAMVAGFGLANLVDRFPWFLVLALFAVSVDAIRFQKADFFIPWHHQKFLELEKQADRISGRNDKFLVNEGLFTRQLFFLHRQGRAEGPQLFREHPEWMEDYGREGLQYICIDKSLLKDTLPHPVVLETPDFRFYKIEIRPKTPN